MLNNDIEQPDDCHLLAICDATMPDLNYFPEGKFKAVMMTLMTLIEGSRELNSKIFLFSDLYVYINCDGKDH